jgi:hypothetical protein
MGPDDCDHPARFVDTNPDSVCEWCGLSDGEFSEAKEPEATVYRFPGKQPPADPGGLVAGL